MNMQKIVFHLEDMKATQDLLTQTTTALARARAMTDALADAPDVASTEIDKARGALVHLEQRVQVLEKQFMQRTNTSSVDDAENVLTAQVARVEQFRNIRAEQTGLKVALELELTMNGLPVEKRQEAEAALTDMQQRLEALVQQAERVLPSKLVIA